MKLIYNRKPTKEEIERLQDKRIRYRYFDCNDSKRLFTKCAVKPLALAIGSTSRYMLE